MKFIFAFIFSLMYFKEKKLSIYASSLAIYLILSLFPALMIIMLLLNILFIKTKYYELLVSELQRLVSIKVIDNLGLSLSQFGKTILGYGSFSFFTAIIFSTIFIRGFFDTVIYVFEIDRKKVKSKWTVSFLSIFFLVLVLVLLILIETLSSFVFNFVSDYINLGVLQQFYFKLIYYAVIWIFLTLLLFVILKREARFKNLMLVSAISLIFMGVFSKFYFILINKSIYNVLYGSFSALILTIMYMWTIFNIFILILSNFYVYTNFDKFIHSFLKAERKSCMFIICKKIYDVMNLNSYYLKNKEKFSKFLVLKYENKMFRLINNVEMDDKNKNIYFIGY
ncbi:YihY/virulence factor BrkB family protein [Deferribacter autotrophicus]|uniref:YihY/virulence factor BrkB family protein n=1 Tax=Deferribacter autotrophicus TaxID=500465 RepID=A0A5A8F7U0_9BACT|nr:YhjD/YihY/BrkB family envelope integrity protein [Deferribacter autotrophicus]KAA0258028.1 YihY/virulence factor BrkB family protein [Deferribacter autotrophicus]